MLFLKMLLSFAPWIAFLLIAGGTAFRLKAAIVAAALLTAVMALTRLHRGAVMWAGVVFFSYALVAIVFLDNLWSARHIGILANGALAAATWMSLALKRPFTLEYAREHVDRSLWDSPLFLRTNYILTLMWAVTFTVNAALAWQKTVRPAIPGWAYDAVSYTLLVLAMFASTWRPRRPVPA